MHPKVIIGTGCPPPVEVVSIITATSFIDENENQDQPAFKQHYGLPPGSLPVRDASETFASDLKNQPDAVIFLDIPLLKNLDMTELRKAPFGGQVPQAATRAKVTRVDRFKTYFDCGTPPNRMIVVVEWEERFEVHVKQKVKDATGVVSGSVLGIRKVPTDDPNNADFQDLTTAQSKGRFSENQIVLLP